jgi:hypothetical protein
LMVSISSVRPVSGHLKRIEGSSRSALPSLAAEGAQEPVARVPVHTAPAPCTPTR